MGFALPALASFLQPLRHIAASMRPRPPVQAGAARLDGAPAGSRAKSHAHVVANDAHIGHNPHGAPSSRHANGHAARQAIADRATDAAQGADTASCAQRPATGPTAPGSIPGIATREVMHGSMPGSMPGQAPKPAAARPLRVIHNRRDGHACKLVISGRMADVCAELNRLALP